MFLSYTSSQHPSQVLYYLKGSARYFMYKLNELQVYLYTGAVVISTNLEKYYSKSKKTN